MYGALLFPDLNNFIKLYNHEFYSVSENPQKFF